LDNCDTYIPTTQRQAVKKLQFPKTERDIWRSKLQFSKTERHLAVKIINIFFF
jgi:hypothetical protein